MEESKTDIIKPIVRTKQYKMKKLKAKASKPKKLTVRTDTTIVLPTGKSIIIKYHTGRQSLFNQLTFNKLIKAWEKGMTDQEASAYIGITQQALIDWKHQFPDLEQIRSNLINKPLATARATVVKNLDKVDVAKWYLERKARDEFAQSTTADDALSAIAIFTKVRKGLLDIESSSNTTDKQELVVK